MLIEFIDTGSALKENGVTTNINERAKYTANTGTAIVSVANSNLDGSGSLELLITGAQNGTLIKDITIKGIQNVTRGMVRLFHFSSGGGTSTMALIDEVDIPAIVHSGIAEAFEISYELDFYLKAGDSIYASTENDESFSVIAQGLDFQYP
jgi:hypothetical protein